MIKMVNLVTSGFLILDKLENNIIETYGAYAKGYNKNRSNKIK